MSKEEELFAKKMDEIFVDWQIIRNWRPNKLKNEKTGKNLEIDYYIGKYAVGFEYQGGVHFKNIKRFHNDSDKSRYNDLLKYELIEKDVKRRKKSLTIIEIFEYDLKGNFRENLINRVNNSIEYYSKKINYTI